MRAQLLCAVSVSRPGVLSSSGPGRRSFRRGQSPRVAGRRTVWTGGLSWVSPERRDLHDQWGQETLCTCRPAGPSERQYFRVGVSPPMRTAGNTPTAAKASLFCLLFCPPSFVPRTCKCVGAGDGPLCIETWVY